MSFELFNHISCIICTRKYSKRLKSLMIDTLALARRYRTRAIITRGLYTFYSLFEVHLCTVTFGLMYG